MTKFLKRFLLILSIVTGGILAEYHYWEAEYAKIAYETAMQKVEAQLANGKRVLNLSDLPHLRELPENVLKQPNWCKSI